MLPVRRRIRRAEDFRAVLRAGIRAASPTVVVHVMTTDPGRDSRAGFIVGRSVGGSVVRHRVTRQLRHLMATQVEDLAPGTDVVIRALPRSAEASSSDLSADVSAALGRALTRLGHRVGTAAVVSQ